MLVAGGLTALGLRCRLLVDTFRSLRGARCRRRHRSAAKLLEHVREFMGEEPAACHRGRRVLSRREGDVGACREGTSMQPLRAARAALVGVYADPAEVLAETWLHEGAGRLVQRPTATAQ